VSPFCPYVITSRDASRKDTYNPGPLFGYIKLLAVAPSYTWEHSLCVCSPSPYQRGEISLGGQYKTSNATQYKPDNGKQVGTCYWYTRNLAKNVVMDFGCGFLGGFMASRTQTRHDTPGRLVAPEMTSVPAPSTPLYNWFTTSFPWS
jgi:hypothetical protein